MDELLILQVLETILINQQTLLQYPPDKDTWDEAIENTDDTLRLLHSSRAFVQ